MVSTITKPFGGKYIHYRLPNKTNYFFNVQLRFCNKMTNISTNKNQKVHGYINTTRTFLYFFFVLLLAIEGSATYF